MVVGGDYITTDSGTGLVHTAPGHGQEDYQVRGAVLWLEGGARCVRVHWGPFKHVCWLLLVAGMLVDVRGGWEGGRGESRGGAVVCVTGRGGGATL